MKPKLFSPNVILHIHIIRSWTWDVSDDGGKEKKKISRFYPNTSVIHTGIGQRRYDKVLDKVNINSTHLLLRVQTLVGVCSGIEDSSEPLRKT